MFSRSSSSAARFDCMAASRGLAVRLDLSDPPSNRGGLDDYPSRRKASVADDRGDGFVPLGIDGDARQLGVRQTTRVCGLVRGGQVRAEPASELPMPLLVAFVLAGLSEITGEAIDDLSPCRRFGRVLGPVILTTISLSVAFGRRSRRIALGPINFGLRRGSAGRSRRRCCLCVARGW